jgi:predicted nucleic acid-binding Zn ribbon protein
MQSMSDDPVATCTQCRAPVERVFHPVAVHFKGSGFYTTDYGRTRSGGGDSGSSNGDKGESKSESSSESKSESSSESKSDSKSESKTDK